MCIVARIHQEDGLPQTENRNPRQDVPNQTESLPPEDPKLPYQKTLEPVKSVSQKERGDFPLMA
jgi:hypothetical protein